MRPVFFYLLLIINLLTNVVLIAPHLLVDHITEGGLLALPLGFLVACAHTVMFLHVFRHYKGLTLPEIMQELMGRFVGRLISYVYIFLWLIGGFLIFRGILEIVIEFLMPTTSIWYLAILLALLPLFALFHTEKTLLYFIAYLTVLTVPFISQMTYLGIREAHWPFIEGSLIRSLQIPPLSAIAGTTFAYGGIAYLSLYNPHFKNISIRKTLLLFLLVGFPATVTTQLIPIGVWGPWAVKNLNLIWVSTADTLMIDLFLIERGLYLLIPLFLLLGSISIILYTFTGYRLMRRMLTQPLLPNVTIGLTVAGYVVGSLLLNDIQAFFVMTEKLLVVWFLFQMTLTLVMWLLMMRKRKREVVRT